MSVYTLYAILTSPISGAMVDLALCYPLDTTFTVTFDLYDQLTDTVTSSEAMTAGATMEDFLADVTKMTYFVDTDFGYGILKKGVHKINMC